MKNSTHDQRKLNQFPPSGETFFFIFFFFYKVGQLVLSGRLWVSFLTLQCLSAFCVVFWWNYCAHGVQSSPIFNMSNSASAVTHQTMMGKRLGLRVSGIEHVCFASTVYQPTQSEVQLAKVAQKQTIFGTRLPVFLTSVLATCVLWYAKWKRNLSNTVVYKTCTERHKKNAEFYILFVWHWKERTCAYAEMFCNQVARIISMEKSYLNWKEFHLST